jgi:RNA polymerase sigma factor (sigma-70 family)
VLRISHVANLATVVSRPVRIGFVRGEPDAFRAVVDACKGLVYGVAYKVLGDRDLSKDAAQEAFFKAWRAAARFDPDQDLEPWLAKIAERTAIDIWRREARWPHDSLESADPSHPELMSPPHSAERAQELAEVRGAIEALPFHEREVIRLHYDEGLTHPEIAKRLEIPVGTVKSRSHKAHRRLARRLGHDLDQRKGPDAGYHGDWSQGAAP